MTAPTDPAAPDPQQVREIAQTAIRAAIGSGRIAHISHAVIGHAKPEQITDGTFLAYRDAAMAEYDRMAAALLWPDEQPQAERCTCGCLKVGDGCDCRFCNEPYPTAIATDFRNVSEDEIQRWREAFEAQVGRPVVVSQDWQREQAERDADVRAVARVLRDLRASYPALPALKAVTRLEERFADRIAALDAPMPTEGT